MLEDLYQSGLIKAVSKPTQRSTGVEKPDEILTGVVNVLSRSGFVFVS